jgi:heterodisulfide reductase subunit A
MSKASTVLVYGTNLSGYRIAYALGKLGYKTVMLNRGPYVDAVKNQVLSQLPFDLCWACAYAPQRLFVGLGAMQVLYNSELLELKGVPGNFTAKIRKRDAFVNNYICTECEKCVDACPVRVEKNGSPQKAVRVIPKMFWENIYLIDEENCTRCGECERACPTGAFKMDPPVEEIEMEVGAVILAPEFDEPGEVELAHFGWGTIPNVVKSSDIARAALATNFTGDSFKRPSDKTLPQSVAIIVTPQFNKKGIEYENCNASAQAVYRANKIKEMLPDVEVSLFCRDYKCYGKGHCRMYERAKKSGVQVIRTEKLLLNPTDGEKISISFGAGGANDEKTVDMSILITGQRPPTAMKRLSEICGVPAEPHGFCEILPFTCAKTKVAGVYAVGEFTSPKGNPETIWEGYGPLREITSLLGEKNVEKPQPPVLRNVSYEKARTGIFICNCFGTFSHKMDLESLIARVKSFTHVSHAEIINGCCTPDSIQETADRIKESGVNRVVLAVCTPTQKMMKFRKTVMMAGLNPLLSEFLRLREDVIQVHTDPAKMEYKAAAMIYAAAAKLKTARAMPTLMDTMGKSILVIGGGGSGLEAARYLGAAGYVVHVVEKTDHVGGMGDILTKDLEGHDIAQYLAQVVDDIAKDIRITVHTQTTVTHVSGYAGNFHVRLKTGDTEVEIDPALVVIATGALEAKTELYGCGRDERVMTQLEFEKKLACGEITGGHVAMIQCVGSRNPQKPYCSRVCCSDSLKNALILRERGNDVTIFYRDMNTYGFKNDYFRAAMEKGVVFIRFDENHYPQLESSDAALNVKVNDISDGKLKAVRADYLVLSTGMDPNRENNKAFSCLFDLKLDDDGFFDVESCACPYEDASKRIMKPFELSSNGVFVVGTAHSPRSFMESVMMARQAAGKAMVILPAGKMAPPNAMYVSEVDAGKCTGCGLCVDVCPYNARVIDPIKKVAVVHPFLCDSCGACVVACPSSAAFLRDQREDQLIRSIDGLLAV